MMKRELKVEELEQVNGGDARNPGGTTIGSSLLNSALEKRWREFRAAMKLAIPAYLEKWFD